VLIDRIILFFSEEAVFEKVHFSLLVFS
jgi:hypothetical protein